MQSVCYTGSTMSPDESEDVGGVMSQTLTIPDDLYARLEDAARRHRVTIEGLFRSWQIDDQHAQDNAESTELGSRRAAVARMNATRADLAARYGDMLDSTDLIREDWER